MIASCFAVASVSDRMCQDASWYPAQHGWEGCFGGQKRQGVGVATAKSWRVSNIRAEQIITTKPPVGHRK